MPTGTDNAGVPFVLDALGNRRYLAFAFRAAHVAARQNEGPKPSDDRFHSTPERA